MALLSALGALCCLSLCIAETQLDKSPGGALTPEEFNSENPAEISDVNEFDPTLSETLLEGDILLKEDRPLAGPRSAIQDVSRLWPDQQIPYVLGSSFTPDQRRTIAVAMKKFHDRTCLQFVARTTQEDYIVIRLGNDIASAVGRIGGMQDVTLTSDNVFVGIVAHELMHAIGFWHEHTRTDRDNFVKINWANVRPGKAYNFKKHEPDTIADLGIDYDLGSIMHYGPNAFAIDKRQTTIEVIGEGSIGQRKDLSALDVTKINKLYNCSATAPQL